MLSCEHLPSGPRPVSGDNNAPCSTALLFACTARWPRQCFLTAAPRIGAVPTATAERSRHRREVPHRRLRRLLESGHARCRSRASRSASRAPTSTSRRTSASPTARFPSCTSCCGPRRKHKFRFQYIPIKLRAGRPSITREIIFNGQRYTLGMPVNSTLDWKAYRFGYEYDFVSRDRGFGGFILDAKYTDVNASLQTPLPREPSSCTPRGPIPAIGGIGRVYVVPNISITGELTGISIPDSISKESRDGTLRRPRHLRHAELHQQRRRAGRLPLVRRRRHRHRRRWADDTGSFAAEGAVLRRRREVLTTALGVAEPEMVLGRD